MAYVEKCCGEKLEWKKTKKGGFYATCGKCKATRFAKKTEAGHTGDAGGTGAGAPGTKGKEQPAPNDSPRRRATDQQPASGADDDFGFC